MKSAGPCPVLLDLGNTLVEYYDSDSFGPILETAVENALQVLRARGLTTISFDAALRAAVEENREATDFRVRPLLDRLSRIFRLPLADHSELGEMLCEAFLIPIFRVGRLYEDSIPTLRALKTAGHATAIVSNLPWGSPSMPWHRELSRLGLTRCVDHVVLCADVGWRKPARDIFVHAAALLGAQCSDCTFAGDDLLWDVQGSQAAGMRPVLVDRNERHRSYEGQRVTNLAELTGLFSC